MTAPEAPSLAMEMPAGPADVAPLVVAAGVPEVYSSGEPGASGPTMREQLLALYVAGPNDLRAAVRGLSDNQLDTPQGDGQWSARELVIHLADAELHGIARMRRIIAEPGSALQPYDQDRWVRALATATPLELALDLFAALRRVGAEILRTASDAQRARTCLHPEHGKLSLDELLQTHALHAEHHIRQLRAFRATQGW
ncbi:MAG: DinB family protein [Gemmatimonadota bacterium]|nr:DinB family protein [Gemmatimonadota bacterium]